MKKLKFLPLALLALFVFAGPLPASAQAQSPAQEQPSPPQAQPAPQLQPQPQAVQPVPAAAPAEKASAPVAAEKPPAPAPAEDTSNMLPENLGAGALDFLLDAADALGRQTAAFCNDLAALPQLADWLARQQVEPWASRWSATGRDLMSVVGRALIAVVILELLLMPATWHLRRREPRSYFQRLLINLGLLALGSLPLVLFIGSSLTLLDWAQPIKLSRFIVLNTVYALSLSRAVMLAGRFALAPGAPALQLIPQDPRQARAFYRWVAAFGFVTVYGYFLVDIARDIRMPAAFVSVSGTLLGLLLVAMTIAFIMHTRSLVAVLLRGNLSAARYNLTLVESLRLWLARNWHTLATAYIIIGYLATLIGPEGSFGHLLRGTALTIATLAAAGVASRIVQRLGARENAEEKEEIDRPIKRAFFHFLIWLAAGLCVLAAWGADIAGFLATPAGHRISSGFISVGITIAILAFVYGSVSSWIERQLNRQDEEGNRVEASARMRTLLPMLRNMAFLVFAAIAALVALSELGVNIGPLLAGAGALGVAVGIGAQALIKDFLTGISVVLGNVVAIGDVVKVGDHSGVVEKISMRTLILRDGEGAVHILPFSEVGKLVNMTRDFAYAPISVGVAYNTDLRKAMDIIRAVGEEMKKDPKFSHSILQPVDVLGVDKFGDAAIILLAQMRTRPGKQWAVKREFLLRLKERFDKEGIVIPTPAAAAPASAQT